MSITSASAIQASSLNVEGLPQSQLVEHAFMTYSGLVAKIAFKLLRRQDEVSDLVQDVFVAALKAGPRLSVSHTLPGWFATVTVRTALKRLRRRRYGRAIGIDPELSYEEVPAASPDAEAIVSFARLQSAISSLPEELRAAWLLRRVERESLQDVAERCGCSLSTAKRRVDAAQARLRLALE